MESKEEDAAANAAESETSAKQDCRNVSTGKRPVRGSLASKKNHKGKKHYWTQRSGLQEKNKELVVALEETKDKARCVQNLNDQLQGENFALLEKVNILERRLEERKNQIKIDVGDVAPPVKCLPSCMSLPFNIYEDMKEKTTESRLVVKSCQSTVTKATTGTNLENDFHFGSEKLHEKTTDLLMEDSFPMRKSPRLDCNEPGPSLETKTSRIRTRVSGKSVSYKEPSIRTKLRRGDPFTDHTFYNSPRPKTRKFKREPSLMKGASSFRDISNTIVEPLESEEGTD